MSSAGGGFRQVTLVLAVALAVVLALRWMLGSADVDRLIGDDTPTVNGKLVVYCAHDAVYAEPILKAFEAKTGIDLEIKFDTEATKSLGLVELIANERENPRCDVFWNNEQLGTMRLADEGLLEPHPGEAWLRTPDAYRDADARWTGFGARMRVWIVNTHHVEPTREAIDALLASDDLSRVAVAEPLFGTTRTHYTVLWDHLGGDAVRAWHADWRKRGVIELAGNGPVADAVANGVAHIGLTDTDDYFSRRDRGASVAMVPFTLDDGQAIVIPNTVAVVKGTQRHAEARRLVDYLASFRTQLTLAESAARQIPVAAPPDGVLVAYPDDVKPLLPIVPSGYPLSSLDTARKACLNWLRSEYTK